MSPPHPARDDPPPWTGRERLALAVALSSVAAVFAGALGGAFVYDDLTLIAGNPGVHDPFDVAGLWTRPLWGEQLGHWRPLTAQVLATCWWLGDGAPTAFHALALALHLASTAAIAGLWCAFGGNARGAVIAALLFAVHPAHAESIAFASALNDPLCGCCTLHALLRWRHWRRAGRGRDLALAILLLTAALAAKESGALGPLLCLGSDLVLGRATRRATRGLAAGLVVYALLRMAVFGEWTGGVLRTTYASPLGWPDLAARTATGLAARVTWPFGRDPFGAAQAVAGIDVVAAAGLGALLLWTLRTRDAIARPRVRLGAGLCASALLLPALTAGSLGPYPIADRYVYLAIAGLVLCAPAPGRRALAAMLALVAGMSWLARSRVAVFADQATLVANAKALHPDDPRFPCMEGALLLERTNNGDRAALPAARAALLQARALLGGELARRDHLGPLRADVAVSLAWCTLHEEGSRPAPDWDRIEREFARITQDWPDRADAHVGLGIVAASTGRYDAAELAFGRALERDPGATAARCNRGRLRWQRGDRSAARADLIEVLRAVPDHAGALQLLAEIEAASGRR